MIFSEIESGTSVLGEPIPAFKTDVDGATHLYIIGGTHGDEVEGVCVAQRLFEWLKTEHGMEDLPIVVVPILNIDGYRASTRVNSHGVDLNRNYPTSDWDGNYKQSKYNPGQAALSEPENVFLKSLFDKYKPGLILSFHSWKPILNYNGPCKDVADYLAAYNHYDVKDDIGYPTPGSLGTYVPESYGSGVITFECPYISEDKTLNDIWLENEQGLKNFIQSDLLKDHLK